MSCSVNVNIAPPTNCLIPSINNYIYLVQHTLCRLRLHMAQNEKLVEHRLIGLYSLLCFRAQFT